MFWLQLLSSVVWDRGQDRTGQDPILEDSGEWAALWAGTVNLRGTEVSGGGMRGNGYLHKNINFLKKFMHL